MLNPTICPQCFQANEPARSLCWKCMRSMAMPATDKDYIRIFNLHASWSKDDLRTSFRLLARKYHPDANPGNREADSYFKFVNQAYEVLCRIADEKASDKESGKTPARDSSEPHSDMLSAELDNKLRAVIRWSEIQKAEEGKKKPTRFQKLFGWLRPPAK